MVSIQKINKTHFTWAGIVVMVLFAFVMVTSKMIFDLPEEHASKIRFFLGILGVIPLAFGVLAYGAGSFRFIAVPIILLSATTFGA